MRVDVDMPPMTVIEQAMPRTDLFIAASAAGYLKGLPSPFMGQAHPGILLANAMVPLDNELPRKLTKPTAV